MFENTIRRMPIFVGLGLVGLVVVVLAGALLVTGVGRGSGAPSPTATINSARVFTPSAPVTPAATISSTATANPSGTFTQTGSMGPARTGHTATLLSDGRVLIAGGTDERFALASAELYDPATGRFNPTGSMATARRGHTATLLPNGRVLIAGGNDQPRTLASAELFDPATGTFVPTGSMVTAREHQTATLLPNGRVLIAGGADESTPPKSVVFNSAELYDPRTGTFSPTGSMATPRSAHTATLLSGGRVLIAGGDDGTQGPTGALSSAELYDQATGKFGPTGSMATARAWPTATMLSDGRVLLVGGVLLVAGPGPVASAELYDQSAGTFSPTGSMTLAHINLTATLLRDGRVLIAGGYAAELFDPANGTFGPTGSMVNARERQTATLLPDGRVLLVGGDDGRRAYFNSAELYTP